MRQTAILLLILSLTFPAVACTTPQMPYTFLVKRDGDWRLWNNYLDGAGIVVENKDAKTKKVISVDDLLPTKEYSKYVTTAGPKWGEYALHYFTRLNDRDVFRVRTRYGTDVVIDLEAGKPLETERWQAELREKDEKEIKATLAGAASVMKAPKLKLNEAARVHAAIVHAMHYRMKTTVNDIRQLEGNDYIGAGVLPSSSDPFTKQAPIDEESDYWHYTFYETRRLASLALRRFGATPKGFPAIGFLPKDKSEPVDLTKRKQLFTRISAGLTPKTVYDILGSPDYVLFGVWIYDIDDPKPYSARVIWDESGLVKSVKRSTSPPWQGDLNRAIDGY